MPPLQEPDSSAGMRILSRLPLLNFLFLCFLCLQACHNPQGTSDGQATPPKAPSQPTNSGVPSPDLDDPSAFLGPRELEEIRRWDLADLLDEPRIKALKDLDVEVQLSGPQGLSQFEDDEINVFLETLGSLVKIRTDDKDEIYRSLKKVSFNREASKCDSKECSLRPAPVSVDQIDIIEVGLLLAKVETELAQKTVVFVNGFELDRSPVRQEARYFARRVGDLVQEFPDIKMIRTTEEVASVRTLSTAVIKGFLVAFSQTDVQGYFPLVQAAIKKRTPFLKQLLKDDVNLVFEFNSKDDLLPDSWVERRLEKLSGLWSEIKNQTNTSKTFIHEITLYNRVPTSNALEASFLTTYSSLPVAQTTNRVPLNLKLHVECTDQQLLKALKHFGWSLDILVDTGAYPEVADYLFQDDLETQLHLLWTFRKQLSERKIFLSSILFKRGFPSNPKSFIQRVDVIQPGQNLRLEIEGLTTEADWVDFLNKEPNRLPKN